MKLKWNTPLPPEKAVEWESLNAKTENKTTSIRRLALPRKSTNAQLQIHAFTDASGTAFATTIYMRAETNGFMSTSLIFAKSRLRPKDKRLTIPRLELIGLLIGMRASKFVKEELRITDAATFIWTDSEIVLNWLKNPEKSIFVRNQVKKIWTLANESVGPVKFGHVKGTENPADFGTRVTSLEDLQDSKLWWDGPTWLKYDLDKWPSSLTVEIDDFPKEQMFSLMVSQTLKPKSEQNKFLEVKNFSNLDRLLRITINVLHFCSTIMSQANVKSSSSLLSKFSTPKFSATNYKLAELILVKQEQEGINEKAIEKLNLFIDDDGIWRSKSRLQFSKLPRNAIEPIFLPRNNHLTHLIINQIHKRYFHAGVKITHSIIWSKFCGVTVKIIRSALARCIDCKKRTGHPYAALPFPPYPAERMQKGGAFSHIGLDYLGPTKVKFNDENKKLWILLITCLKTRAVWLDGVLDLSTSTFLNALKRFISKRGCPEYILSDNATTFKAANDVLEKAWSEVVFHEDTQNFAARNKIAWKNITPHAAWEGGVYERIVGLAKDAFKKAIGKRTLTFDQMNTLTAEVEALLNTRPIADIGEDSVAAIRPFDFLQIHGHPAIPLTSPPDEQDEEWLPNINST